MSPHFLLVLLTVHWTLRGAGVEGLPVDVKGKCSKILVLYLAKSFTERLEISEFHEAMILFTFFNGFRWFSYLCDDPIVL